MARYKDAIQWMVDNDDTDWCSEEGACLSVSASLVADLFGKTDEQVREDLTRALDKDRRRGRPQSK